MSCECPVLYKEVKEVGVFKGKAAASSGLV